MVFYLWLPLWGLSFLLAIVSVFAALKGKEKNWLWFLLSSMLCALLAMLAEYALVNAWVLKQDWSALADVVPGMYNILTAAVLLCEALNVTSAIILLCRKK